MRVVIIFILLCESLFGAAQNKFTLNGYVKDTTNGESIIGATVSVNGKSLGSNQYGFYSIIFLTVTACVVLYFLFRRTGWL